MGRFERDTAEYDRCLQIEVGERVRMERMKRGWSVIKLADMLEISESTLYDIESGRIGVTMRNLHWLSKYFALPVEYLMYGDEVRGCECAELADIFSDMDYKEKMCWVQAIRGFHEGR